MVRNRRIKNEDSKLFNKISKVVRISPSGTYSALEYIIKKGKVSSIRRKNVDEVQEPKRV